LIEIKGLGKEGYLYLKSYTYHENLNLFLKQRVASFESSSSKVNTAIEKIESLLSSNSIEFNENEDLKKWLAAISYNVLPKSIGSSKHSQQKNNSGGVYISNVKDADSYKVDKLNYFINAPVELHIIEMIWCLVVGPIIDKELSSDCYGNRLNISVNKRRESLPSGGSNEIFKRYIDQYNQWRDKGLKVATEVSKEGENVALLSLDFKSYFYYIDFDFNELPKLIENYYSSANEDIKLGILLTKILKSVFEKYNEVTKDKVSTTHEGTEDKMSLPIGLASSSILANWYLNSFDQAVSSEIRPVYYGRYVDDVIMVIKQPIINPERPVESFVFQYLNGIVERNGESEYKVTIGSLPLQKDKLILQYFDHGHSRAGLEAFKQELDEKSSGFRFLPDEHIGKELDRFAYDILYEGSSNKFRSIVGLAENQTELSKYISSHITAHRLCNLDADDFVLPELKLFFKGENALEFSRLWEKVYQYAVITENIEFLSYFYKYLNREIEKIDVKFAGDPFRIISNKVKKDLITFNRISLTLTLGLLKSSFIETEPSKYGSIVAMDGFADINAMVSYFRKSNMIRHHLIAWPLANYTNFDGNLTKEKDYLSSNSMDIDQDKVNFSPRFIHYDEWQIFKLPSSLLEFDGSGDLYDKTIKDYPNREFISELPEKVIDENLNSKVVTVETLNVDSDNFKDKVRIGLSNLSIDESDVKLPLIPGKQANVSFKRQEELYSILNNAIKENVDILVMPEVSIPVSWLPFMISHARRHQIGLVFGLEYWVVNGVVFNLLIEALPFKTDSRYKSCVVTTRIKNHYAPREIDLIENYRLKYAANLPNFTPKYHRVVWRGLNFASYNCYELADINHRGIFKSELDMMFACVWNKDTNYYSHILESAVRDLHCYLIQSNTSQYGGSCVLQPAKTEKAKLLYVKGGQNASILTAELDIKSLRDFQLKSAPNKDDAFKHLPPGFDHDRAMDR